MMSNHLGENQGNHKNFQRSTMLRKQQQLQDQGAVASTSREVIVSFNICYRGTFLTHKLIKASSVHFTERQNHNPNQTEVKYKDGDSGNLWRKIKLLLSILLYEALPYKLYLYSLFKEA